MLRAFARKTVLERFPLAFGLFVGVMQAVIVVWAAAVWAPPAVPGWIAAILLVIVLASVNARVFPWATRNAGHGTRGKWMASIYVGSAFGGAVIGTGITLLGVVFASLHLAGIQSFAALQLFRGASIVLVLGLLGLLSWGFGVGGRLQIRFSRLKIPVDGLEGSLRGLRIVHISDLHLGNGLGGRRLEQVVQWVNAENPDLIAVTGDLFDHDPAALVSGARRLGRLRARLGVFAVLGNHDDYVGFERVEKVLAEHAPGIVVLRGAARRVSSGTPITVVGLDDPGRASGGLRGSCTTLQRLAERVPPDDLRLLLVHRPELLPHAAELGFQLVLAGHYHGGQVALPLPLARGKFNAAQLFTRFHGGLYRDRGTHLHVSRGIGFAGPRIRLGVAPEIAVLELVHAGVAAARAPRPPEASAA